MLLFPPLSGQRKRLLFRLAAGCLALLCLVGVLCQAVFARNTFVITDGDQVKVHTTFASDPAKVLSEAGVELHELDTYTTQTVDGDTEITVRRGRRVTVLYGGETYTLHSYGETVGALLDRLGIPTGSQFQPSLPLSTQVYDGMNLTVHQVVRTEQDYTEDIPYETAYLYDPSLPDGVQQVRTPGAVGQRLCKTQVTYVDGELTQRKMLEQTVVQAPVKQLIAIGSGTFPIAEGAAPDEAIIGDGVILTPDGQVLTYEKTIKCLATAYTDDRTDCKDTTATGTPVRHGTVAVDPKLIPYGTRMFIVTADGSYTYGIGTAEDCGGLIKNYRLDLYFPTLEECYAFGARDCTVYILGGGK